VSAAMIQRFQMGRWSEIRLAIHALTLWSHRDFPAKEYFNVQASVRRLNDAYDRKRIWVISGGRKHPKVQRIK